MTWNRRPHAGKMPPEPFTRNSGNCIKRTSEKSGKWINAWMGVWRQTLYWSQCYEGQIHPDHAPVIFGMVRKSVNPKRPMGLLSDMLHKYMRQCFNYQLDLSKPPRESLRDQHSRRRAREMLAAENH